VSAWLGDEIVYLFIVDSGMIHATPRHNFKLFTLQKRDIRIFFISWSYNYNPMDKASVSQLSVVELMTFLSKRHVSQDVTDKLKGK